MNSLSIGIGAGLASALLFGAVITGSPVAMLLSFIAPLPIFIASLGWKHRSGLVAAATGAIAIAIGLNTTAGLAFALGWALPAWWLAYLALLGRPLADGTMEWYPLGRLLLWIAATAALITLAGILTIGEGSYEAFRANTQRTLEAVLQGAVPAPPRPEGAPPNEALNAMVGAMPFLFAWNFPLVLAVNLWLAGKAVQMSGRLPRPWPFIPGTAMPRTAILALAAALLASVLPGLIGGVGLAVTGALFGALSLQGLAFMHERSQGKPTRPALLIGLYVLVFATQGLFLFLVGFVGLADLAFSLRKSRSAGAPGPRTPFT